MLTASLKCTLIEIEITDIEYESGRAMKEGFSLQVNIREH